MKVFFIKTFGCQANKSDSERIAGDYVARGFKETSNWKIANEVIINTCSVRQRAEDRVKGFLLNIDKYFKGAKSVNKPKIILTGCMLHHSRPTLKSLLPQVSQILPIGKIGFNSPAVRKDKHCAYVPISSGCNAYCAYCIVPYSRGKEISRPAKDIVAEIKNLLKNGYQEITLLGQNVNSYGLEKTNVSFRKPLRQKKSISGKIPSNLSAPPFVKLLQDISNLTGLQTVNFLTANPWDFHPALIKEIAQNKKINRFIHLPVQSGSNRILKLMNRGYTAKSYIKLINQIKTAIPEAAFGTDIIVGFPGETNKDFQDTVNLVKKVGFQIAFIAQYSPRPGTVSCRLYPDSVSPQVKKKRWQILENLINQPNLKTRPAVK